VVVPPVAGTLAAAPFRSATVIELGAFTWRLPRGPVAAWLVPLALALLVALVLAVAGLGALLARWAPAFLGPSPAERLALLERQAGQLAERNRLARELHDSVGHALAVATLQAGAARKLLDSDPAFARDALASVEDASRAALDDLDHVSAVVSREAYRIVQEGLTNALRHAGRVAILGGQMTAGADGASWRVAVTLPLRPGPGP
jgi:signal transduction histidine kinase